MVDHIDTNRCNNRPVNLRWLTRLENALNNPATLKKITFLCGGDIQKFLDDPSCLRDTTGTNQDVMWMRTVSAAEARDAFERIMSWAAKPDNETPSKGGKMGEWIYQSKRERMQYDPWGNPIGEKSVLHPHIPIEEIEVPKVTFKSPLTDKQETFVLSDSITPTALQGNWRTPADFVCCPLQVTDTPLEDYFHNLKLGAVYLRNSFGESTILDFAISKDKQHLWVLTEQKGEIKPWAVSEIVMYENNFLHLSRHTYFSEIGGRKYFTLYQGKQWNGEDCIDDYC